MRRLRLLGMITFLSGSTSLLNLPRKVTTRHRNERFRSLLARCNPLRSALVGPGEGLAEPASNDAIAEPIARSANPLQGLLIAEPFASEAEHVEESRLHLRPSRGWQRRDERPQVGSIQMRLHSTFSTQALGRPSASERLTSHAKPLACVDSGMTGTWDNDGSTSSRPRTSTGRFLSGALKRNQRISPRRIKGTPARRHPRSVPEGHSQSTGSKP